MIRFLAVDDEPLALKDIQDALREAVPKCQVTGFTSAAQALEYGKNNPVDVAFLDIEMGRVNGLDLAKQLKSILSDIHIIFVTSHEQYAVGAFHLHATGYLMKPATAADIQRELTFLYGDIPFQNQKGIYVQTFGGFQIFVDGKPLVFVRNKTREMLAVLVDRRGANLTTRELCAILWEDTPYDTAQKNYLQQLLYDLRKTLQEAGASNILVKRRNSFSVDPASFECDSYRFLDGDPRMINAYHNNYLPSYSWAEFSIGRMDYSPV